MGLGLGLALYRLAPAELEGGQQRERELEPLLLLLLLPLQQGRRAMRVLAGAAGPGRGSQALAAQPASLLRLPDLRRSEEERGGRGEIRG